MHRHKTTVLPLVPPPQLSRNLVPSRYLLAHDENSKLELPQNAGSDRFVRIATFSRFQEMLADEPPIFGTLIPRIGSIH